LEFTAGYGFAPGAAVVWGGNVTFSGGSNTLGPGMTYTPQGVTTVSGGALSVTTPLTLSALAVTGGTLGGTATVTVGGTFPWTAFTWTGGTLGPGADVRPTVTATLAGGTAGLPLNGGNLTLGGPSTWSAGTIFVDGGSVLTVGAGGVLTATGDNTISRATGLGTAGLVVATGGTFRKQGGTGVTTVSVPLTNTGAVEVNTGTLAVDNFLPNAGAVRVGAAATLQANLTNAANGVLAGVGSVTGAVAVNAGGVIAPGSATGVGTLTAGGPVAFGAGSVFRVRLTAGNGPAAPGTGGSSNNTAPVPPTTNDFLSVTAGALSFDPGATFVIDRNGAPLVAGQSYSYRVAQSPGQDLSGLNITDPSQFTTILFTAGSISVTGDATGTVYLNLVNVTPVPEPGLLLAAAAVGLGATRLVRRNRV
jgi:hypothetical protein